MDTEVQNALIQLEKLTDLYLVIFGENSPLVTLSDFCYTLSEN